MRIQLPRLASNAVALLIASVLFAGCSSATNVTPSQGGALGPNSNWAAPGLAHRVTEPNIITNREVLTSTSGSGGGGGCAAGVTVSGKARGPYHGTFTGSAGFGTCENDPGFSGEFVITSGANTITGSFSGMGQGSCGRGGCGNGGKMTYTATLEPGGKTFSGKGHAGMSVFDGAGRMDLYLQRFI